MASKKSKDYGKKMADRKEPLASLKRFVKACRQVEAEDRELVGDLFFTAGETLFGVVIDGEGRHHKSKMAEMLDAFLGELKDWKP
jgi:hypothetical protein